MKKKLSIILCCFLMLSIIMPFQHKVVLAAETKANEFKSEVEGSTSNFVKFFIEDRNHELILSEFDIQLKNSQDYSYTFSKAEYVEAGWLINITNLTWQEGEKKYISVSNSKYLLTKEITKADEGSTIELKPNENLVPLQISVPFAGENFEIDKIRVDYVFEENGIKHSNYGGVVNVGALIPQGNCSIQLIAYDENNAYNLVKQNWEVTKDNNLVDFDRNVAAKIKVSTDNLQSVNGELAYIVPINFNYAGLLYESNAKKGNKIYDSYFVNKESCHFISYGVKINNWDYNFRTKYLQLQDDFTVINVGVNLKANIKFNKNSYVGGEGLTLDSLMITDEYDNDIKSIYGPMFSDTALVWELTNEKGETTTVPLKNIWSPTVPNVVGTFDISIKNLNGPLNISCDPVKITITSTLEPAVKFVDTNLEAVIREAINKPQGEIYKSELTEIFSLNCNERNISSLEGIENLTNLGILTLSKNNIEDITPLRYLNNLIVLNLYRNKVKSIDALENISNLASLVLDVNQIEDINILKDKVNLKELSVCANPVKNLEVLRTLPNLTTFHFGENANVDIAILECLPNLTDLRWAYTRSTDNINVLENMTKLERVRLSGNKIKDITPLANLTNISELYVDENEISDITPLVDNCTNGGFTKAPKFINLSNNNLDIAQGAKSYNDVQTLISKGINVIYAQQNTPIPQPSNKLEAELITKVQSFKAGEDINLEYKITNNATEEKEVTLIIGVYNEANKLVKYVKTSKIVKVGEVINIDGTIELQSGAFKVKAFIWDSLCKMNPYIDAIEIPVN